MTEQTLDPDTFAEMRDLMDDALEEFIITFLENSPRLINSIEQNLSSQNSEEIFHNAHQLKGGSGSIGAMKLSNLSRDIEQISRAGSTDGIDTLLTQLKEEFKLVSDALKAEL